MNLAMIFIIAVNILIIEPAILDSSIAGFCLSSDGVIKKIVFSEEGAVEGFDVGEGHVAGVAGGAYVGEGLVGETVDVGFTDAEFGEVLGYAHFDGEVLDCFAGCNGCFVVVKAIDIHSHGACNLAILALCCGCVEFHQRGEQQGVCHSVRHIEE